MAENKNYADQCPRINKEFLADELATLGPLWYNQEYFCSFESDEFVLLNEDEIEAAMRDDLPDYDLFKDVDHLLVE